MVVLLILSYCHSHYILINTIVQFFDYLHLVFEIIFVLRNFVTCYISLLQIAVVAYDKYLFFEIINLYTIIAPIDSTKYQYLKLIEMFIVIILLFKFYH